MKSLQTLFGVVAVVALASAPALAQGSDRGGSGGGGGGGGGHTGTSAPGGGGGGAAGGGGMSGGGGTSGGGGYVGGGSSGGGGSTSGGFSGGSSSTSVGGASPMGGARPLGGAARERAGRGEAGIAMVRGGGETRNRLAADPGNSTIPGGSRPNYGNPTIGSAVPRGSNTGGGGGGGGYYPDNGGGYSPYYPYYGSYGLYPYGYPYSPYWYSYWLRTGYPFYFYPYDPFFMYGYGAFGLGLLYYDPFWFAPGAGVAPPGGGAASIYYGTSPLSGNDASGSGSLSGWSAGGWSSSSGAPSVVKGALKLKVTPKDAEVYVDGYFVGKVEQYNSAFQRLDLPVGVHRVELRAKGFNNVSFEVKIEPRDTQTYHGTMQRLQPVK